MGNTNAVKLGAEDLRRLWHYVMSAKPGGPWDVKQLRAAAKALGDVLSPTQTDRGLPALHKELGFTEAALTVDVAVLGGISTAMAQAITGESDLQQQPAPFGIIEHVILPLARILTIEGDVVAKCPTLRGSR